MRVKCHKKGLPRIWKTHPDVKNLVAEFDIPLGSLYAKLLIFESPSGLQRWWRSTITSHYLPKGKTLGAVNGLFYEVIPRKGKPYLSVDPRYFCVISLQRKHLTMEVITHESVHAACCFMKRKTRAPWADIAKANDEEALAYPAGRIAAAINRILHKENLYL